MQVEKALHQPLLWNAIAVFTYRWLFKEWKISLILNHICILGMLLDQSDLRTEISVKVCSHRDEYRAQLSLTCFFVCLFFLVWSTKGYFWQTLCKLVTVTYTVVSLKSFSIFCVAGGTWFNAICDSEWHFDFNFPNMFHQHLYSIVSMTVFCLSDIKKYTDFIA